MVIKPQWGELGFDEKWGRPTLSIKGKYELSNYNDFIVGFEIAHTNGDGWIAADQEVNALNFTVGK